MYLAHEKEIHVTNKSHKLKEADYNMQIWKDCLQFL